MTSEPTISQTAVSPSNPSEEPPSLDIHERLINHLRAEGVEFKLLQHAPCRTSAESAAARASAGAPNAIGAKALLVRTDKGELVLFVLPGMSRLDAKAARKAIGRGFRFATAEEMATATGGLTFGTMPPIGRPLFDAIGELIVDPAIVDSGEIGFNAACTTRSVVMAGAEYARIMPTMAIVPVAQS